MMIMISIINILSPCRQYRYHIIIWWWHGDDGEDEDDADDDDDMVMMMMTWWWCRGDDMMTWWHDDMMTWCHDRAVPLIQTSTAIELYKGQNSCVDCNFTLHHCKFPVLPDPLIVNLQCAGPQHCKSTVGTTCERDPKEMDVTMGIQ